MNQRNSLFFLVLICFALGAQAQVSSTYFPPAHNWERKDPALLGLKTDSIRKAIHLAINGESKNPRSMEENHYRTFGKEPFGEGIGPFADRGQPSGLIIYKGYIVASWGEPERADMTHSVTKSFLSAVVGLAYDRKMIRSVDDRVADYVPPIELYEPAAPVNRPAASFGTPQLLTPFASAHNSTITWDHMLRQTSDWEGTLWGKPDWADRPDADANTWLTRKRNQPGTVFEYNDVRVNALALATTSVWRKPLPQVLKELLMDPIGASNTWRWTGYRNAWIVLDGAPVQSVSGGGHWGGGMFINAYDMARFGWLTLNRGKWNGQQILSEDWVKRSLTPTSAKTDYGYMNWFLNTNKKFMPSAPESAFVHVGNGNNLIYVDPSHQLVAVIRWIDPRVQDEVVRVLLRGF